MGPVKIDDALVGEAVAVLHAQSSGPAIESNDVHAAGEVWSIVSWRHGSNPLKSGAGAFTAGTSPKPVEQIALSHRQ